MKVIAGGRGAANPYAAIAQPYLQEFHKKMIVRRGGTKIEVAFNKLTAPQRKAIFVLGNAKAEIWPGKMAKLGFEQIGFDYHHFTEQQKLTLISGMKALKELSEMIPYSQPGEEAAARLLDEEKEEQQEEELISSQITGETNMPDALYKANGF